jgi:putative PIN family toxin of toxin-antitoxin system
VRVVFDTNIYVSALVLPGGQADLALARILDGLDTLLISKDILAELLTTLARKFSRDKEALSQVAAVLAEAAEVVIPRKRLRVLADEPDNRVLECAEAGEADCIVTGDKAMLKLGSHGDIRIISLQYLGASLS